MAKMDDRNWPLPIPSESGPELAGCNPAPAHEGMAEARGFTETQGLGNLVNGPFGFVEQQLGALKTQVIEQRLVAATHIVQVAAQGARRAVHVLGQPF